MHLWTRATPIVDGTLDSIPSILKGDVFFSNDKIRHKRKFSNMGIYKLKTGKDNSGYETMFQCHCISLKRSLFVFNFVLGNDTKHLTRTSEDLIEGIKMKSDNVTGFGGSFQKISKKVFNSLSAFHTNECTVQEFCNLFNRLHDNPTFFDKTLGYIVMCLMD